MTKQKVLGRMKLFEDLTIEIVEGSVLKYSDNHLSALGQIDYPSIVIDGRARGK